MIARPCGHRWDIPLGDAALRYASLGYAVLPLDPGAKKPHRMLGYGRAELENGVHYATTSAALVTSWWERDPQANIGVATGAVSSLMVTDLDTKRDDGPAVFWGFLQERQLGFSWGAAVPTPSGGWHFWLRTAQARERRGILPGVDIKGNDGYVVAAPSVLYMSDGAAGQVAVPYSWYRDSCACSVPPAPEWMGHWLQYAPAAGTASGRIAGTPVPDDEHGFSPGTRNDSFYLTACKLYGQGWDDSAVIRRLRAIWDKTDQSGMRWHEVTSSAASAKAFIAADRENESTRTGMLAAWARRNGV